MKKIFTTAFLICLSALSVKSQSDPAAVSILDKFSARASASPSVSINFTLVTVDQVQNYRDSLQGSVVLGKDSYRLDLPDNIIWYNGTTSWSYLPAEQEVTITEPDKNDDSFTSRPSRIFTIHREGFKTRLLEESSSRYVIDLYPEDVGSDLIRVRLTIAKPSLDLKSLEYKQKDGITMTLAVRDFKLSGSQGPGFFDFIPSRYKGVDIIDMR